MYIIIMMIIIIIIIIITACFELTCFRRFEPWVPEIRCSEIQISKHAELFRNQFNTTK